MTHVDWHPFPEEKPKKGGLYLVTFKEGAGTAFIKRRVGVAIYVKCIGEFGGPFSDHIVAWAEKPKPYQPEAQDE